MAVLFATAPLRVTRGIERIFSRPFSGTFRIPVKTKIPTAHISKTKTSFSKIPSKLFLGLQNVAIEVNLFQRFISPLNRSLDLGYRAFSLDVIDRCVSVQVVPMIIIYQENILITYFELNFDYDFLALKRTIQKDNYQLARHSKR